MTLFPDVQRRAQAELDSVVGTERLPDFSDRPCLPYVNALIKEIMRWFMIAPIGVAHRSFADDVYDGFHIPAGTIVLTNSWYVT